MLQYYMDKNNIINKIKKGATIAATTAMLGIGAATMQSCSQPILDASSTENIDERAEQQLADLNEALYPEIDSSVCSDIWNVKNIGLIEHNYAKIKTVDGDTYIFDMENNGKEVVENPMASSTEDYFMPYTPRDGIIRVANEDGKNFGVALDLDNFLRAHPEYRKNNKFTELIESHAVVSKREINDVQKNIICCTVMSGKNYYFDMNNGGQQVNCDEYETVFVPHKIANDGIMRTYDKKTESIDLMVDYQYFMGKYQKKESDRTIAENQDLGREM